MSKPIYLSLLALSLCACSSVGVQYAQPNASQDSADYIGPGTYINSFNDKGCYTGRTFVKDKIKLLADKEVVVAYEAEPGQNLFCRVLFSFVPEKNEKYQIQSGISTGPTGGKSLFGNPNERTSCVVVLEKVDATGVKTPVTVTGLKLQTGFACIKAVPK